MSLCSRLCMVELVHVGHVARGEDVEWSVMFLCECSRMAEPVHLGLLASEKILFSSRSM